MSHTDGDLWHRIGERLENRCGSIQVLKVDSHMDIDEVQLGLISTAAWVGNILADALAAKGASMAAIPDIVLLTNSWAEATANLIQTRLIATERLASEADPSDVVHGSRVPTRRARIAALIEGSDHKLVKVAKSRYRCTVCHATASRRSLAAWLRGSQCKESHGVGMGSLPSALRKPEGPAYIGGKALHDSHNLFFEPDQKAWVCLTCGSYAVEAPRNLAQQCKGSRTKAGEYNISRLAKGMQFRQK